MRYRTFVMLSAGGMLLAGALISVFYRWLDPETDLTRTLLISALVTGFVLALDLLLWRLAPEALESAGFRLGERAARHRRENPPAEEYALGDEGAPAGRRTVYRMDAGFRILLYGMGTLFVLIGLGMGALYLAGVDTDGRNKDIGAIGNGLFVLFFVVMGGSTWRAVRRTRLVLSTDDVVYRTMGYSIVSRWGNVRGIGPARYGRGKAESLLLHEPGMRENGPFGALVRAMSFAPDDAIPLQGFGSARYGPLSRDLRRYAPHLFDEDCRPQR
jgi:hypothetical protein